jgi:branched-chain amino acid aminotransferase
MKGLHAAAAAGLVLCAQLPGAAAAGGEDAFMALQTSRRVERAALPDGRGEAVLTQLAPAAGLAASEEPLTPDDLRRADEAFLTNALLGLLPVASLDGARIGPRRSVGPRLAQLLSERLSEG